MADNADQPVQDYNQLIQKRIPLEDAADAFFVRDESGRIPVIVAPSRASRVRLDILAAAGVSLVAGIGLTIWLNNALFTALGVLIALILLAVTAYQVVFVFIPEGVSALLARRGKYWRAVGSGRHFIPPWIRITHLVTQREIPYDVPVLEAPTGDGVRANVDALLTFKITDPYLFVYNVSASDFDQVFQAACQRALRALIRGISSDQVTGLTQRDMADLRQTLSKDVEPYGVSITNISITFAEPPADFMRSLEAQQLATVQKKEQAEKQALSMRRLQDEEDLARQKVLARVERDREELQIRIQQAEAQRRIVELEAEAEDFRLGRLEERLRKYPRATKWDWETYQLDVARALAGNTRAVLQIGKADDIVRALTIRDFLRDQDIWTGHEGEAVAESPAEDTTPTEGGDGSQDT